ncbi:unnamed protein product, partial [Amoebophrya sp. A120]|eukprot:GSA120T00019653001.1
MSSASKGVSATTTPSTKEPTVGSGLRATTPGGSSSSTMMTSGLLLGAGKKKSEKNLITTSSLDFGKLATGTTTSSIEIEESWRVISASLDTGDMIRNNRYGALNIASGTTMPGSAAAFHNYAGVKKSSATSTSDLLQQSVISHSQDRGGCRSPLDRSGFQPSFIPMAQRNIQAKVDTGLSNSSNMSNSNTPTQIFNTNNNPSRATAAAFVFGGAGIKMSGVGGASGSATAGLSARTTLNIKPKSTKLLLGGDPSAKIGAKTSAIGNCSTGQQLPPGVVCSTSLPEEPSGGGGTTTTVRATTSSASAPGALASDLIGAGGGTSTSTGTRAGTTTPHQVQVAVPAPIHVNRPVSRRATASTASTSAAQSRRSTSTTNLRGGGGGSGTT